MSFKKRMKEYGNNLISQRVKNPYYTGANAKKNIFPLWAIITIPSTFVTLSIIVTIVLVNSFGKNQKNYSNKTLLERRALNKPQKPVNSDFIYLSYDYIDSINTFSSQLFSNINDASIASIDKNDDNVIVSPLSVINSVYSLYDASAGTTRNELATALNIDETMFDHLECIKTTINNNTIDYLNEDINLSVQSSVSNALVIDSSIKDDIKKSYIDLVTTNYYSNIYYSESSNNDVAAIIEEYSSKETNDYLSTKSLLNDSINLGKVNFFNTTYFQTNLFGMFESETSTGTFNNNDGSISNNINYFSVSIGNFYVIDEDKYYVFYIPIPLKELCYYFNFILPKEGYSLSDININTLFSTNDFTNPKTVEANYSILLPSFTSSNVYNLSSILQKMGVSKLFTSNNEDLSGISNEGKINKVDNVIYAAGIGVSPDGISDPPTAPKQKYNPAIHYIQTLPTYDFVLNKPFFYSITDCQNTPIFVGKIVNM